MYLKRILFTAFSISLTISFLFLISIPSLAEQDVIKLGAALSLTGKLAKEGKLTKDGYDFWKDYVNAHGGIKVGKKRYKVEIKYYDDESNPQVSAKLVEKLIVEDGIKLILGPYGTTNVFAASAVSEKYRVPMVEGGAAGEKIFERGFRYIFGVFTPSRRYLEGVLELAKTLKPRPQTVAIIAENELFSIGVAEGAKDFAERNGFKVVHFEKYPPGAKDISSLLSIIKAKNPDILLGAGHFADTILAMRQCKDLKVNPKMYAFSVGPPVPDFVNSLRQDAEYVFGASQWEPSLKYKGYLFGSAQDFAKKFKEKFGYEPDYHAAGGAAAALAFQIAIENAGSTDPEKVRNALQNLNTTTFWGPIRFDKNGMIIKPMVTIQIQNGKRVVVHPPEAAEAKPIYPTPPWEKR